ncbi:pyridoxal phosphate phosphatase PHOSPHO2-like [Schistocerca cancellata]|uniref:pyridoxal phosphate phosphatase PHOSPHO2-like n=1 Tax=Schistocerca cancellata TaxID=274614 RepID=UPI002118984A|nr:pyridoxal phosphate phosphatase PHOSPHO2-like [Schistocerca cancellata]
MLRLRKSIFQMSKPILVAFDFDHTIADQNTDIVVRDLLPREKITDDVTKLYRSDGWTAYMQKIFFLLHENGIKPEAIEEAVEKIPVTAGVDKLLKFLHQTNNEVIIISDSNSVFIRKWLEATCLNYTVRKVFTNPAHYDDNGCLRIQMYHIQDWCELSTKNLCKGHILEEYLKEREKAGVKFHRVVYVGDGKNDLCPCLRLGHSDIAFPRCGYALAEVLCGGGQEINASVHTWKNGEEIMKHLSNYFNSDYSS